MIEPPRQKRQPNRRANRRARAKRPKKSHKDSMDPMEEQHDCKTRLVKLGDGSDGTSRPSSPVSSNGSSNPPLEQPIVNGLNITSSSPSDDFLRRNSWHRHETFNSDSGISVSSSPEVNVRSETMSGDKNLESDAYLNSSYDSDSEIEDENPLRPRPIARSSSATIKGNPPRSITLPDNDAHIQRLQDQEEEARNHILHSPRPQRSLRPAVTSAYEPSPLLPLYDRHATSTVPTAYPFLPPAPSVPHVDHSYFPQQYPHAMRQAMVPEPPYQLDTRKQTIAGYELLASKLARRTENDDPSEPPWHPIYRKFEQLNHRILLHLQDEISELEEELRLLDESIAQTTPALDSSSPPAASRRAEARFGTDLHYRRTEVLGKIFLKLGQYNQALESYNSATRSFAPAEKADIAAYRAWIDEKAPIDKMETRFLSHENDLMSLTSRSYAPRPFNLRHETMALCLLVLLPLAAFSMISGLLPRMSITLVLGFVGASVLSSSSPERPLPFHDSTFWASIYFVVMTFTAAVI